MKINAKGFWEGEDVVVNHYEDEQLTNTLLLFARYFRIKSTIDLGCGKGDYVKAFKKRNLNIEGYDGNPATPVITDNICQVLELHKDITKSITNKFDLVMSFEVGEHIPKKYENIFIDNLVSVAKDWLIISWALPEQEGHGHVNCQSNEHIIEKLNAKKFKYNKVLSAYFRSQADFPWFKNTIMVFKRRIKKSK